MTDVNVIHVPGEPGDGKVKLDEHGCRRWAMKVEFTWPLLLDDVTEKFAGDAEVDFAARAVAKIRNSLEVCLRSIVASTSARAHVLREEDKLPRPAEAHYHIISTDEGNLARRVL